MHNNVEKVQGWAVLTVDEDIYDLSTVYAAGYVFLERAYIYLDKNDSGKILVKLYPKNKKENLDTLGMDFFNELLNYAHYFTSLKANAEAMKMLMQKALFSAAPSLAQDSQKKQAENLIKSLAKERKPSSASKKVSKKR
tara:strand:- start:707 stop:1123 length:417 start_codon:yes stop_codon:yes gene_type:complete